MYPPLPSIDPPIPPSDILKAFAVHEPLDTRFRSCARLLQSIWRRDSGFVLGEYFSAQTGARPLGSRLASAPARAGFNYLTPEIAKLVRRELAYRERGALIEEERAWTNLLSSSALVFNLFGPLKMDPALAKKVLKLAFGIDAKEVFGIHFETSPGRGNDRYIGDRSAFDVLLTYSGAHGRLGFAAIEVKYSESQPTKATPPTLRLQEVADRSELYAESAAVDLFKPGLRQFTALHCLANTLLAKEGPFDEGSFFVVSPSLNTEMSSAIGDYSSRLNRKPLTVPFAHLPLDQVVTAIGAAGAVDLEKKLSRRYVDFTPINTLIDEWVPHQAGEVAERTERPGGR